MGPLEPTASRTAPRHAKRRRHDPRLCYPTFYMFESLPFLATTLFSLPLPHLLRRLPLTNGDVHGDAKGNRPLRWSEARDLGPQEEGARHWFPSSSSSSTLNLGYTLGIPTDFWGSCFLVVRRRLVSVWMTMDSTSICLFLDFSYYFFYCVLLYVAKWRTFIILYARLLEIRPELVSLVFGIRSSTSCPI